MTLAQMRGQVMAWLGLQDITSYDETQLATDKIYQGTLDVLARTRCTVRCVQLHVQANVDEYILDQHIMALHDVENGTRRRMRRDVAEAYADDDNLPLGVYYPGPASEDYIPDLGFVLIRSDILRVVPAPSADGTVQVWAVLKPQPLALDTDSPSDEMHGAIPEEYHDAIVTYALWKCADYADDQSTAYGDYYRTLYEGQDGRGGRLAQIRIAVNRRGTNRAPRSRVNLSRPSSPGAFT